MESCNFCGKKRNEVKLLVSSNDSHICNTCIIRVAAALGTETKEADSAKEDEPLRRPTEINEFLGQHIIAQDTARQDVAVAVYNHYKRREATKQGFIKDPDFAGVEIDKSNILLLGPTGTGKTLLARTVAKMLKVPFYVADATRFTSAGYVGDDVENMLQGLIADAGNDAERAQWGIIVIDEIDKLARKSGRNASGYRDVSGEGVQQSLLKLIEGSVVKFPHGEGELDTTNVLFMCFGSFAGIEEVVKQRVNQNARVGFGVERRRQDLTDREIYASVTEKDILEFGIIPELKGRLPVMTTTLPLTEEEMVRVLTEPKNAIIKQFRALFAMDDIDLHFDAGALAAIAQIALKLPMGARGLRSIVERVVKPYAYDLPGDKTVRRVIITKGVVNGTEKAEIVRVSQKIAAEA